jgi:hypothetical protein
LLFKLDYRSYSESSSYMDCVCFKPCALSQVSKRCLWRFHANSKSASRFLCNRPDRALKVFGRPTVFRTFSVEEVWTSGQHRPEARSSFSNFYTELDFSWHLFGKFLKDIRMMWQHVRTLPNVLEYSGFPLWTRKGVIVKIVRTLGQAVRTWSCFGKNRAILEMWSQKTVRTRLSSVRMLHSQSLNLSRIRFSEAYI